MPLLNQVRHNASRIAVLLFGLFWLSGCAVTGKHAIEMSQVEDFGFSKPEIINLGQLVQINYTLFHADEANANQALPTPENAPQWRGILALYQPLVNLRGRDKLSSSKEELYGHVWKSLQQPSTYVISIRGTSDTQEWLDDFKFGKVRFDSSQPELGRVERGFDEIYRTMSTIEPGASAGEQWLSFIKALPDLNRLIVVGHSLGSSLATLVAFDSQQNKLAEEVQLLTFASPLTGNLHFVKAFEAGIIDSIRIVNKPDLVPRVPPRLFGFRHIWRELLIDSHDNPEIKHSVVCYHSLLTYLHLLDKSIALEEKCKSTP